MMVIRIPIMKGFFSGPKREGFAFVHKRFLPELRRGNIEPRMVQAMMSLETKSRQKKKEAPELAVDMAMGNHINFNGLDSKIIGTTMQGKEKIYDGTRYGVLQNTLNTVSLEMCIGNRFYLSYREKENNETVFSNHFFKYTPGQFLIHPGKDVEVIQENSLLFDINPRLKELMGYLKPEADLTP